VAAPRPRWIGACLYALLSLVCLSCQAQTRVFSRTREALGESLRSGDTEFLKEISLKRMPEALALGPGGAYVLSLHFSRLGMREHAEALLAEEAAGGSGLAGRLALEALVGAWETRGEWKAIIDLSTRLPGRLEASPACAPSLLAALYRLGEDKRGLDLYRSMGGGGGTVIGPREAYAFLMAARSGLASPVPGLEAMVMGSAQGEAMSILAEALVDHSSGDDGPPPPVLTLQPRLAAYLDARRLIARRDYGRALSILRSLPGAGEGEAVLDFLLSAGDAAAELVSEAGRAWMYGGGAEEGVGVFTALSERRAASKEARASARLVAARCALAAGQAGRASSLLSEAEALAGPGRVRDAAIWFRADQAASGSDLRAAADELLRGMPSWSDPAYFSDVLGRVISDAARQADFKTIERLWKGLAAKPGTGAEPRLAYILMRAKALGLYTPSSPISPPSAEVGPLSYFGIMFAVLEGRDPLPPALALARSAEPEASKAAAAAPPPASPGVEDGLALVGLLAEFGMAERIPGLPASVLDTVPASSVRDYARLLYARDEPAAGLRLMARLASRPGYAPLPEDYRLLYPQAYPDEIGLAASENALWPPLLFALVRSESSFDSAAGSTAGARGLAQLMPETAASVAKSLGMQDYDLLEPADNAALGAAYLAGLIKRAGGDLLLALMSYNGGPTRVMRLRSQSPGLPADLFLEGLTMPETRDYGRKVLAAAAVYGYLMEGREFAATIEAFLPGFPSRWAN